NGSIIAGSQATTRLTISVHVTFSIRPHLPRPQKKSCELVCSDQKYRTDLPRGAEIFVIFDGAGNPLQKLPPP
ncbi:MAG: hypothetical protein WCK93_09145, partial [Nitrosomonadales bacterium]